jgi:presequence protease
MTAFLPTTPISDRIADPYETFELLRRESIASLSAELQEYRHKVTGASHFHLAADNDENVFMVAFRTQPMDSSGVAHVLEHTALCGSKQFPVRDPFFSMIRRSLNTFMNAFTSADWTAYPFASQNKADFFNLLSVYLDAAFYANIDPLDFAQEGIRIELENGKPVYKGVVFNEMKGAMSSPTDQLYHQLAHTLYPTTTYHYNSGGDPADIPQLTHQKLVDFYRSHYHPSNAVFMTYGNIQPAILQQKFEEQALAQFKQGERLKAVAEQRYAEPQRVEASYAVDLTDGENLENRTHIVMAWLLPKTTDIQARFALRLLEGVLLEDSASPLRQYIETCGLGESPSPLLGLDDSNYEMSFLCGLQGSNPEHADAFEQGVLNVLEKVASGDVQASQVEAVLHQMELQQREISGGYPYGLQLLLNGLGTAIHGGDPLPLWNIEPLLAELRENLKNSNYLPQLVKQHLLDNPHRVRLVLQPDPEKTIRDQQREQAALDKIEAGLTADDRTKLDRDAAKLAARQAQVDDLSVLPKVGLADIPIDLKIQTGQSKTLQLGAHQADLHCYAAGTNGLYYNQVIIELPQALLNSKLLSLYVSLVGSVGAGDLDYLQLQQQQTAVSGGVGFSASLRTSISDQGKISAFLVLSTKALTYKLEAIQLLRDAFVTLRLDEADRIVELLQQRKSRWQSRINGSGHAYAMQTSSRTLSALAQYEYAHTGLPALLWLTDLLARIEHDETVKTALLNDLLSLHQQVIALPRQFLLIAEDSQLSRLSSEIERVWTVDQSDGLSLAQAQGLFTQDHVHAKDQAQKDLAWLIQTNVQYCAAAYPAPVVDHPDTAAMMVLGPYLRNGFLHRALREQGGAYGGGAGYDGNACAFRFHSYRDPRLAETFDDFQASIDWLIATPQEAYQLEEAILGLMGAMDKPSSPSGEAMSACYSLLHGRTPEQRRALRQSLLDVTIADLQRVAKKYLTPERRMRAVVAPYGKEDELKALGFTIERV